MPLFVNLILKKKMNLETKVSDSLKKSLQDKGTLHGYHIYSDRKYDYWFKIEQDNIEIYSFKLERN